MEYYGGTNYPPPPYPPQPQPASYYQQQNLVSSGPSYPQPGYGACAATTNVIVTSPTPHPQIIVAQSQIKPSNYLGLAIVTCLLFNIVLGIIAIIMSVMSDSAYGEGNIESARQYGRVSMILSMVGIVMGIAIMFFVVMFFAVWDQPVVYYDNCAYYTDSIGCNNDARCIWRSGYCGRL